MHLLLCARNDKTSVSAPRENCVQQLRRPKILETFSDLCASQTWPEGVLLHSMTHQKDKRNKHGDGSSIQFITMTQDAETERIRYSDRR